MKKTKEKTLSPISIIRQASLVLAMAVALPFFVHLLPLSGSVPAGARLLPVFLAPLIGVYFFRPALVLPAALLAPILNFLITGQPQPSLLFMLTLEISVFTVLFSWLLTLPRFRNLAALFAIVSAKLLSAVLMQADMVTAFTIAAPGIMLITMTSLLMNRFTR